MEAEEHKQMDGGWTVVIDRRAKHRPRKLRSFAKSGSPQKTIYPPQSASPDDQDHSEYVVLRKVESAIAKLQVSPFFSSFIDQLHSPALRAYLTRVMGSHSSIEMVVYGIGSIASCERARLQFAIAVLLRRALGCVSRVDVFDPIISSVESGVIESFGCSMISTDESGRRIAFSPTLFFMPHCDAFLYDNLLEANWGAEFLNRIVILGNSFGCYDRFVSEFKQTPVAASSKFILRVRKHTKEVAVKVDEEFFSPFHDTSWHFFDLDIGSELGIDG